jgi:hypothetical protein
MISVLLTTLVYDRFINAAMAGATSKLFVNSHKLGEIKVGEYYSYYQGIYNSHILVEIWGLELLHDYSIKFKLLRCTNVYTKYTNYDRNESTSAYIIYNSTCINLVK